MTSSRFWITILVISGILTATTVSAPLKNVGIYYGYLNSLNSANHGFDNTAITTDLNQYDILVVGDGLQRSSHPDYTNTQAILSGIDGDTEVFGYIPLGNTQSLCLSSLITSITQWKNLGVEGIFVDEFGFDFWNDDLTMRKRQNAVLDFIHKQGLKAFVNAFNPDDVFTKIPGRPSLIKAGDIYLYESYAFTTGTFVFADHVAKINKITAAKTSHPGVLAVGVSTTTAASGDFNEDNFKFMTVAAHIDGLDGIGWGVNNFGATDAVMPFRPIDATLNALVLTGAATADPGTQSISRANSAGGTATAVYNGYTYAPS